MDQAFLGALIGGVATAAVLIILIVFRKPVKCEKCGREQPKVRTPTNIDQMMWGGTTCIACGSELDARGRVKTDAPAKR
jgi:hypothetical protein